MFRIQYTCYANRIILIYVIDAFLMEHSNKYMFFSRTLDLYLLLKVKYIIGEIIMFPQ